MTRVTRVLTTVAAATLLAVPMATAAVPVTPVKVGSLPVGDPPGVPHLVGTSLVDGTVRVTFNEASVALLGTAGDDYLVGTGSERSGPYTNIWRVTATGTRTLLTKPAVGSEVIAAEDGSYVFVGTGSEKGGTQVTTIDAATGEQHSSVRLTGYRSLITGNSDRVVLASWTPKGTFVMSLESGYVSRISTRVAHAARLSTNLLASLTKDPYRGGCTVVSRLTNPAKRLWRSCTRRVEELSPGGTRMATVDLLADGIGPGLVEVRRTGGRRLAAYSASYFSQVLFDGERALVAEAYNRRRGAVVRCVRTACERVSGFLKPLA